MADRVDAEQVAAAQAGDPAAMEDLLRSQQERIFALCRRMMGNHADALDAAQEAMIAVVRGLPSFDRRSRVETWIYRVSTNACLDELRRRSRRPLVAIDADSVVAGAEVDPATGVAERLDVDAALAELSPDFRAAVVLRDLCQLDYAEIGEVLGLPPGTVRSRIARGRANLADLLAGGNPEPASKRPSERS